MKKEKLCPFTQEQHAVYMYEALEQARKAFESDEVPIGAVVVDGDGIIVGRGYNRVMEQATQSAHAEVLALQEAGCARGDWRLDDCWLYVTLEPCMMCMGLIRLSRLAGVVYGAKSPLFGFVAGELDKASCDQVYKKDVMLIQGIAEREALQLLQLFFKKKRSKDGTNRQVSGKG